MTAWTLVGRVVTERSGQIKELFRLVEDKGFVYQNGAGREDQGKNQDVCSVCSAQTRGYGASTKIN